MGSRIHATRPQSQLLLIQRAIFNSWVDPGMPTKAKVYANHKKIPGSRSRLDDGSFPSFILQEPSIYITMQKSLKKVNHGLLGGK